MEMYDDLGTFVFLLKENFYSSRLQEKTIQVWNKTSVNAVSFSSRFFSISDLLHYF